MAARLVRVPLVVQATPDYSSGDFMGGVQKVTDVLPASSGVLRLVSVSVLDAAKAKGAFDILFFNALPIVASAENAALDITLAQMVASFIGRVSIVGADYTDSANCSDATKRSIDLILQGSATGDNDLWVVCQAAGTINYAASTDVTLILGFDATFT